MDVNQENDFNNEQVGLESQGPGGRAESCGATEGAATSSRRRSAEDAGAGDKTSEQESSNLHVGEAALADQEKSEVAGVDALQRAISAATDSHIMASMAPHDPLNHTLMANIGDRGNYNIPPATPFRGRPGEEPNAPPLALHGVSSLSVPLSDAMVVDPPFLDTSPILQDPPEAPRIQAFAKLEFDDGQFYMNTYSVTLGRDIRAARAAYQREQQERESTKELIRGGQSTSGGDASQTAFRVKRGGSTKMNGSVVSGSGGIIGVNDPDDGRRKKSKKGSKKSKSTSSSSQQVSRKNSIVQPSGHTDYQALAQPSNSDGAHPVDPSSLLPSPEECPLIPIHPPAVTTGTGSHKGISRKHAKIAYNFDTHIFEVEIKGKNGAFVDDQWYAPGDVRPLKSGSFIQIGGVGIRFLLPEVVVGQTDAEEHGCDMSPAFENNRGVEMSSDADEGNEDDDEGGESGDEDEEEEDEDEADGEEREEDAEEEEDEAQESPSPEPVPQPPPARRGPGRPPKNGISKRELELAGKEAREKAKAKEKGKKAAPPVTKNKVGRPRKNPQPETPPPKPEKRKYTKRKVADATGSPTKTKKGKEPKEPKPPKEKKEKRPPKPPRSPSPVFDESKLTAEELQKPQASYVVLIHEALTNSKTGAMSLPQIYRAIERKYPFYKLRVQTTGWQSSVRHNLSQHHAFRKVERDGKGWLWGIVPGVSIEKERKKRLSPPPHHQQPLQQQPRVTQMQHPVMPAPPGLGKGPAGPPMRPIPPNGPAGVMAGYGTSHPSSQAGPPRGSNALPTPNTNVQGATFIHSTPSDPIPQQRQAPQSHSGKTAGPGFYQMQENRLPPTQASIAPATRLPPSATGPTSPQIPQYQTRSIKLNEKTLQAIASFQTALVAKLQANGSKDAEAIVQSAINRALGITTKSSVPGKEDPQEVAIIKAVSGMLNQINNKQLAPSSSSSASGGAENKQQPQQQSQQPQQARPAPRPSGPTQQQSAGQGGRAVQAQLIHFLSTALNKGGQKISPQRPTSSGNASAGSSGMQTRLNGTAALRPPPPGVPPARTTGATVPINANKAPTSPKLPQQQQQQSAAVEVEKTEAQSPPPIAGVKRPLENGDAVEGQPEAKKIAVGVGAASTGEDKGA